MVDCIANRSIFYCHDAVAAAKLLQSCPTLCDPIDGNPPGSSVPGTFQARTLEWVAIAFSIYCHIYSLTNFEFQSVYYVYFYSACA